MTKPGRIPCINPTCKRTAQADKHPDSDEIICGKCFRALPDDLRKPFREAWKHYRKWERRVARTSDELKLARMRSIRDRCGWQINVAWSRMKQHYAEPERPAGIENFLSEMGMAVDIGERSD